MEDGRRTTHMFDASAYLLFEASGDSEAQCSDAGALDLEPGAAAADDDAQSCSYGSVSDGVGVREVDMDHVSGDDLRGADFYYEEEDDGGGSEGEEDGVVDQWRGKEKAAVKSNGCEDSNAKTMNEREGDRLFWEACLAS
ncbi:hypothetical protein Salat_2233000 [Sesamum alatum]|uniref:Uncharacterized protein n=1 Tax=Sesamum alatum TaxID=300844 RepID=A0AAE2CDI0_9LAMI|nr:hypothetical protein Salat_2233000 [Sesamum alatum]